MPPVIWTTYKVLFGGHFFLQLDIYTCKLSPFIVYFCFVLLGIYHYKHLNPAQNTITLKSTQSRLTRDRYVKGVTFHHCRKQKNRQATGTLKSHKLRPSPNRLPLSPKGEGLITILTRMAFIPEAMP